MEVLKGTEGKYPLVPFLVILILLFYPYCSAAAGILVKSNTTVHCNGGLNECLIKDEVELDFMMNPYVTRILRGGSSATGGTGNPSRGQCDAVPTCVGSKPCRSSYSRGCGQKAKPRWWQGKNAVSDRNKPSLSETQINTTATATMNPDGNVFPFGLSVPMVFYYLDSVIGLFVCFLFWWKCL